MDRVMVTLRMKVMSIDSTILVVLGSIVTIHKHTY